MQMNMDKNIVEQEETSHGQRKLSYIWPWA
jgi:hypothetical protein